MTEQVDVPIYLTEQVDDLLWRAPGYQDREAIDITGGDSDTDVGLGQCRSVLLEVFSDTRRHQAVHEALATFPFAT